MIQQIKAILNKYVIRLDDTSVDHVAHLIVNIMIDQHIREQALGGVIPCDPTKFNALNEIKAVIEVNDVIQAANQCTGNAVHETALQKLKAEWARPGARYRAAALLEQFLKDTESVK